jgi:hypothetical protein
MKAMSNFKSTKAYFSNADVKAPRGPTIRAHNKYRKSCASTYHAISIERINNKQKTVRSTPTELVIPMGNHSEPEPIAGLGNLKDWMTICGNL